MTGHGFSSTENSVLNIGFRERVLRIRCQKIRIEKRVLRTAT